MSFVVHASWIEVISVDGDFISSNRLLKVMVENLFYLVKIFSIHGSSLKMDEI